MRVLVFLTLALATVCGCGELPLSPAETQASPPERMAALSRQVADMPPIASDSRAAQLLSELKNVTNDKVFVVAHRGHWHAAPENSLAAIQSCIELGVDMVEIDVRPTMDGRYVLLHDKTLERSTNGTGKVSHHSLQQIQSLRFKDEEGRLTDHRIATLEEGLQLARGKILLYLDKSEYDIPEVYKIVKQYGMEDHVFFYGNRTVDELKSHCGDVFEEFHYLPKLGDSTTNASHYIASFTEQKKPLAFVTSFAKDDSSVLTQFDTIRQSGIRVWASPLWDELCAGHTDERALKDPAGNWGWLLDRGATMLCTDQPRELLEYLRSQGRHD
ncbi:putative glycerophosphoryl diester phosphodiesterase 1 [Bremerella volcania]|uniref:Putative glycerophosphoryl diester phosphodiesterase 1 n=1 Tax=Bremerella volcania TaxID=2527984 RepID=A0A518C9G3_9BACT|nr:glycerophosphodiester phosphodiesterase family protein [Bremerella volcania]QDU75866.1 putative glycerophosphoryl diester phosphodiesterase 1 [Bremerella volcania]